MSIPTDKKYLLNRMNSVARKTGLGDLIDAAGGGGGADTALSNLTTTAITEDLNMAGNNIRCNAIELGQGITPGGGGSFVVDVANLQLQNSGGTPKFMWDGAAITTVGDILPDTDNNDNIGSLTDRYSDGFFGGNVRAAGFEAEGQAGIFFYDPGNSNYIALRGPATASGETVLDLPSGAGLNGQFLTTNGSTLLTWSHPGAGATITAGGTTGNQTINNRAGTVNFAATATSLTVTNNQVTANSIVMAVIRTNDATAEIKNVTPSAGSFVINLSAAATAETSVGFYVLN